MTNTNTQTINDPVILSQNTNSDDFEADSFSSDQLLGLGGESLDPKQPEYLDPPVRLKDRLRPWVLHCLPSSKYGMVFFILMLLFTIVAIIFVIVAVQPRPIDIGDFVPFPKEFQVTSTPDSIDLTLSIEFPFTNHNYFPADVEELSASLIYQNTVLQTKELEEMTLPPFNNHSFFLDFSVTKADSSIIQSLFSDVFVTQGYVDIQVKGKAKIYSLGKFFNKDYDRIMKVQPE